MPRLSSDSTKQSHIEGRGGDDLLDSSGVEEREESRERRVLESVVTIRLHDVEGFEMERYESSES